MSPSAREYLQHMLDETTYIMTSSSGLDKYASPCDGTSADNSRFPFLFKGLTMTLTILLNVAISLILIYLVLSLVASEIQELIATLLEWRAKHLKEAIQHLLGESSSSSELTDKIYANPLIQSITQEDQTRKKSRQPSYITSKVFAITLLDSLTNSTSITPATFDEIVNSIETSNLPESLRNSLSVLAKQAKCQANHVDEQIQKLQQEIELWFDRSMESASGVYKRNAKGVALVLGFLIALILNADTLYIVDSLAKEPLLRSTIAQVSDQVVNLNSDQVSCLEETQDRTSQLSCLDSIRSDIDMLLGGFSTLPIGWDLPEPLKKQFQPFNLNHLVKAITGWLLTSIAISMGANFWFDALSKVVNVRNSGKRSSE